MYLYVCTYNYSLCLIKFLMCASTQQVTFVVYIDFRSFYHSMLINVPCYTRK